MADKDSASDSGKDLSGKYIAAIDQGTTSTRCMIFNHEGRVVAVDQKEHEQIFPQAGWVEHDAKEIWENTRTVTAGALAKADLSASDIAAVGITNQRETALVWDKNTGEPVYNAIVWQDTRTDKIVERLAGSDGQDKYKAKVGLPLATYFSGPKVAWILENVDGAREKAEAGDLIFGNMDTWVLWNLTGGPDGGLHVTDPTNASRTMLMDLDTLDWDADIAKDMDIPLSMLPEIRSSSEEYGHVRPRGVLAGVPIAGILGDQQAATFGQACLSPGDAKNTYGTGNFMLINTGTEKKMSSNGLLTTICYKIGDQDTVYALEGSIAVTGSLVQWVRDNLGLIPAAPDIEKLAKTVDDNGGAYFVPAFSGLFAPYWRSDARGAIVGLTRYVNKGHLARAVLEATAFQSREVLDAMNADSGVDLTELKVDGGMVVNETLMQFQADIIGVPVIRPVVNETTALGAAYAAGLAVGYWESEDDIRNNWAEDKRWDPQIDDAEREKLLKQWKKAVTKTFDWVDADVKETEDAVAEEATSEEAAST
ncbi:glycerol kinase GlpK [Nakamurella aerolata]|uniref:Glycerol kinase n=1 Tax=Nakamurella aerolata TaxID=1656892 RepID=A0A849AA78_9ACTN|nr:glycerol kinase GlpK [Nakamurella aerolata]NNG36021.1 glycerol kinase GlpK [Nakamurella aerolata]